MTDPFTNNGQLGSYLTLSGREIELKAEQNNSGAITELTWNGFQFINAKTKDRALQTQVSLDNFGQTDFATLNEAGAASQGLASPSSARYVEGSENTRQLLTKSFLAYDTPLSYDGLTLFCSGNILEKKIDMDFLGDAHIVRATWRVDQYASTKQGAFRWGINLSLNEDLTEQYLYDPANDASPVAQADGDAVSTFLGGPIAATSDGQHAIGLFHAPSQEGNTFTTTFTAPGTAEGGDPQLTTNQSLVLDTEASLGNLGSAAGTRHVTRYICVGTLAEVQAAFDLLEPYVTDLLRDPDGPFDPEVVTGVVVQSAPVAIRRNIPFRITVAAVNALGARVLDFSDTVTVRVQGSATLTGTLSKSFVNGLVEFDDLALNQAGPSTLRFSTTGAVGSYTVVVNNPVPTLGSLSPASLPDSTVAPGVVTATGLDFRPGIEARIQGVAVPTTRIDDTSIRFDVPQAFLTEGFRSVAVFNPAPGGGLSNSLTLAITDGYAPLISDVNVELQPDNVSAQISWTTDERASSEIQVLGEGLGTGGYVVVDNNTNETRIRNHSVLVENLEDAETYTYYITAEDDAGNRTQPQLRTFVTSDTTPPVFLGNGVEAEVFQGGATLRWSTNEAASASIRITGDDGSDTTVTVPGQPFSHEKIVTGLLELVTYTVTVTAIDAARNTATSTVQFSMEAAPDDPLFITNGPAATVVGTRVTISWELNRDAGRQVVITNESGDQVLDSQGSGDIPQLTNHSVPIGAPPNQPNSIYLAPDTVYYYRVQGTASEDGVFYQSEVNSFTTDPVGQNLEPLADGDEVVRLQVEVPPGKAGGDTIMVHSVVPLLEQADLDNFEWVLVDPSGITQASVQRELVSYNPEHASGTQSVNAVEVIFPVTIPTGLFSPDRFEVTLVAAASGSPGANLTPLSLDGLDLVMGRPGGAPDQEADIFADTNSLTLKQGPYCVERRFYNRLTDGSNATLGVHTYVTEYDPTVDSNVYVRMLITNSHVDTGASTPQYGTPGKIFFDTLTLDATALTVDSVTASRPLIHRYPDAYCVTQSYNGDDRQLRLIDSVADLEDAVSDRFTFRSVDGVRSEVWHAGGQRIEHVAIGQSGQTADDELYQTAVLEYQNIAWPISGRNYGQNARWWGPAYMRSGELPDSYVVTPAADSSLTGADAYDRNRMRETANSVRQLLRTNSLPAVGGGYEVAAPNTQELGCWSPGYRADGSYDGVEMMSIYETQPRTGHTVSWSYWADQVLQRHHMTMFNSDGTYVTAANWRTATDAEDMPFDVYSSDNVKTRGLAPFFNDPEAPSLYDQPVFGASGTCPYDINDDYNLAVTGADWAVDANASTAEIRIPLADYGFGPNVGEVVVTRNFSSGPFVMPDVSFTYSTATDELVITVPGVTAGFNGDVSVVPSATWDTFTPIAAGAVPRLLRCYLGMVNTCNASLYKDLLEFQAEYYLVSESRTHHRGALNEYANGSVGELYRDFSFPDNRGRGAMLINALGGPITPYVWGRDKAWAHFTIAAYHMHTPVQELRDENIAHFEALEEVISYVMPGGNTSTYASSSTARRIAQHIRYTEDEYREGRADLAATRYSIADAGLVTVPFVFDLGTRMSYQPGDPSTRIEAGVTSLNYATLEVGVFHDFTDLRFPTDGNTSVELSAEFTEEDVILGSILEDLADNYVHYETADNNMLCHMYYAVGEALHPTYAGAVSSPTPEDSPPGRLFIYAYEMILAREKHENYYAAAADFMGTYGGFNRRGASGLVNPGNGTTGIDVANPYYNEEPKAPYATLYRNEPLKDHSFYPELSAAYAAQRLRAEPLSLNSRPIMAGLRINYNPEYYTQYLQTASYSEYEEKISSAAGKWGGAVINGLESWPMASPWMGEAQYQIANAGAPTVSIQWSPAGNAVVEGTTRTYNLFTLGGATTTEAVVIDLLPTHTTSQRPVVRVNGVPIADDPNNQQLVQVTLAPGADTVSLDVEVADDDTYNGEASINITASINTGPGFIVGEATRTIAIEDDDFEFPQTATFERQAYNVLEGNTQVVTIKTQNPIATNETLDILVTTSGSSVEGSDYNLTGDILPPDASGVRTVTLRGDTPGGDGKTATFTVEALSDAVSEGDEQLTFAIQADQNSPYGLGRFPGTTVTITEETGGGENDGLLISRGIQTGDGGAAGYDLPRMWSTTLPMHTPSATLPEAYMIHPDDVTQEKVQADVFGITKNQDGEWLHVAVSCPLDHASGSWSLPDDGSINSGAPANPAITVGLGAADSTHSSANSFYDLFVTRCSLEIKLANVATPYEFTLGDQDNGGLGAPVVEYSGLYNRRTTYYGRFSEPTAGPNYQRDEQCLVCKVTVDERTDAPVALVDVSIQNSVLTGVREFASPYEEDPAADGTVYFDYIKFKTNTPGSGEEVRVTTNAPRESTGPVTDTNEEEFWIVKPMSTYNGTHPDQMTGAGHADAGQQHGMLPGHQILRRLALFRSTIADVNSQITGGLTSSVAQDFARRYDWGWTVGEIGYQNGGWSLENYYIPDWRIFRDQTLADSGGSGEPGLRGLALEADAIEARALTELSNANIEGSSTYTNYGWAKPSGVKDPAGEGADYINFLYFEIPFFGGINAELIKQERIADRQAIATFSLATRRPITPLGLIPDDGDKLPYGHDPDKTWSYLPAWLNTNPNLTGATDDNPSSNKDTWDLAPTDLPWNSNDTGRTTFYMQTMGNGEGMNWQTGAADWGPIKATHSSRSVAAYGPLYLCNNSGTRSVIEIEGSSRLIMSEVYEPTFYRTLASLDTVSLRHLDRTRNNTRVTFNGETVTGRNLNFGFGYTKANALDTQTLLDNATGSSNIGTRYYAHSFMSVAHYYAVTDRLTREEITDGNIFGGQGEIGDGISANFPHLVGLYLGRKLSPCGSLDLRFTNIDNAYGVGHAETGWNNPTFTVGYQGSTTYNGITVPIWSDLPFPVAIQNSFSIGIRRGSVPGVLPAVPGTYNETAVGTGLTHNNVQGAHFGWASTSQTAHGMRLAMTMPRVFSTFDWTSALYNNVWSSLLLFADIYGQGSSNVATPNSNGKYGTPFNKKHYVDHNRSRPAGSNSIGQDGAGTQGINNDPTSELQGGRNGALVMWPAEAPDIDASDSDWITFAFNAQAYAVDVGTFGYANIGMKNTRYEGGISSMQSDQDQREFFEAHYFEGVGTDEFQSRHYLLPVIGYMRASGYGQ